MAAELANQLQATNLSGGDAPADDDWRAGLKKPSKDTRQQTEVQRCRSQSQNFD